MPRIEPKQVVSNWNNVIKDVYQSATPQHKHKRKMVTVYSKTSPARSKLMSSSATP